MVGEDGVGMVGHGGRFAEGVCAAVGEGLGEEGGGHLAVGRAGHGPPQRSAHLQNSSQYRIDQLQQKSVDLKTVFCLLNRYSQRLLH